MVARVGLVAALAVGLVLVVGALALSLVSKAAGTERLTDAFRPVFAPAALSQTRNDMDTIKAMSAQVPQVSAALPRQLGMTPAQFGGYLGREYPALGSGLSQLDAIVPRFDGIVAGLQAQRENFAKADAIPIRRPISLPAPVVPWLFILPGAVVVLAAAVGLLRPGAAGRAAVLVVLVVGAVLVVAPLALNVPGKARAVDELTAAFRPAFSDTGAAVIRKDTDTVQAMADQLRGEFLPAAARRAGVTQQQLVAQLGQAFPDFAAGLAAMPQSLPRFQALVRGIEANRANFRAADSVPLRAWATTTLTWLFVLPGLALVLAGGVPLLVRRMVERRSERASAATGAPAAR